MFLGLVIRGETGRVTTGSEQLIIIHILQTLNLIKKILQKNNGNISIENHKDVNV